MTEALDAMVKAMAAELKRQDDDWAQYLDEHPWMKDEPAPGSEGYNLNHVARAGLLAIREPSDEMLAAGDESPEQNLWPALRDAFPGMIDEILKTP